LTAFRITVPTPNFGCSISDSLIFGFTKVTVREISAFQHFVNFSNMQHHF
jgi:hypothetical protein